MADAVIGKSIKCGHCDLPVLDGTAWAAIDEPYFCLVHETCVSLFNFDERSRMPDSDGKAAAANELDELQRELHTMISRPWWQKSESTKRYHKAVQQMLLLHQSLRTAGVIEFPKTVTRESLQALVSAQTPQEKKK